MEVKYRNNNKEIFAPLKNAWLVATPEEIVKQETICKLVDEYGYDLKQMEQDSLTNSIPFLSLNTIEIEYNKKITIVINCLGEQEPKKNDFILTENYAILVGAKFFAIAYSKKAEIFFRTFELIRSNDTEVQLIEISDIPKFDEIEKSNFPKPEKNFSKEEFKNIFFSCHDIIRNNDKFSPEMAFDEIAKILFIKITKERESGIPYTKEDFKASNLTHIELFNQIKKDREVDRIFDTNDRLRVKDISFEQILDKLKNYNLSEVPEDIKGVAFEEFLGKTFRGDLGQFFTPRTLVEFMVSILDPKENELICDPCCGSGGFLIESFKKIKSEITDNIRGQKVKFRDELFTPNFYDLRESEKEKIIGKIISIFNKLEEEIDTTKANKRLNFLSDSCIYGTDAEPRSARTAKMNMFMQGDGHSGVHHHDGLLDINGIYKNRFDVILTNPPFGSRLYRSMIVKEEELQPEAVYEEKYKMPYVKSHQADLEKYHQIKSKSNNGEVSILDFYEITKYSSLTEVAFMERCLNLLQKGGRMGAVLPEGFLNGAELEKVREYLVGRAKILLIVSIPQEVFVSAGASVKSSLVFLKKFTEEEEIEFNNIKTQVIKEVEFKYNVKLDKVHKKEKDQLEREIFEQVKERFDYEVPIAEVKSAGISSTGQSKDTNELDSLSREFAHYRGQNHLWTSKETKYDYQLDTNGKLLREPPFLNDL